MEEGKLTTAILGLAGQGQLLARAAIDTGHFRIKAVADHDPAQSAGLQKLSTEYRCAAYDDYRQLIIQNQLDCLLVAADIHSCGEHIRTAMKKRFNILKLAPPARDFEETAELVKLAEGENIKFAVANPARFAQSFSTAHKILRQGRIEHIFLIEAFCSVDDRDSAEMPDRHTDPKLAGGGVLLHDCYHIIDLILWCFPVPEQVYSLSTNQAPDKQQRLYRTEDTAVVSMRFTDALIGNLIAFHRSRLGLKQEFLRVYGKDKVLTVTRGRLTISPAVLTGPESATDEESVYDDNQLSALTRLLDNFGLSLIAPEQNRLSSSGSENLKNMAVIKSAYLSARTGFPEEPGRILQMAPGQSQLPENA